MAERRELFKSRDYCPEHGVWSEYNPNGGWYFYHANEDHSVFHLPVSENNTHEDKLRWEQQVRDWVAYLHKEER